MKKAKTFSHPEKWTAKNRPIFLFLTILLSIFAAETLIMVVLGPIAGTFTVSWALFDAFLLSLVIYPILYFFSLRPLRNSLSHQIKIEEEKKSAEEFDRIKSEFISSAAHELLTPLTSIRGYVEMLQSADADLDSRQRGEFLATVYHQTEVLERIVDDMLDLGRIESGQKIRVQCVQADFGQVIEKAIATFRQIFPGRKIEVSFPEDLPPLLIDPIRIDQVLANLLSNAAKYSSSDTPIFLSVSRMNNLVACRVQDQGIGMTPEQLEHIFEYFYRVDTSDTKRSGLGLGLSISKLIIEEHEGTIRIESEPGIGTTVVFTLAIPRD